MRELTPSFFLECIYKSKTSKKIFFFDLKNFGNFLIYHINNQKTWKKNLNFIARINLYIYRFFIFASERVNLKKKFHSFKRLRFFK